MVFALFMLTSDGRPLLEISALELLPKPEESKVVTLSARRKQRGHSTVEKFLKSRTKGKPFDLRQHQVIRGYSY